MLTRIPSSVLLLLPQAPSDISITNLRSAYGPALKQALLESSSGAQKDAQVLDIAIQTECVDVTQLRAGLYDRYQAILAGLYRLVAVTTAAEEGSKTTGRNVDVRIVFVIDDSAAAKAPLTSNKDQLALKGPLVSLSTIASSSRSWKCIYSIESEDGESLLQAYTRERKAVRSTNIGLDFEVRRIRGGPCISIKEHVPDNEPNRAHASIAVGGTFDHLHLGHKLLLSMTAFLLDPPNVTANRSRFITVGITGDELLKNKKYAEVLESWEDRQLAVYQFLAGIISFDAQYQPKVERRNDDGPNGKAVLYTFHDELTINCVEISDPFGPTITDESITALVVSGETRSGGEAVNQKRGERQWAPLDVFEVGVLDAGETDEIRATGTEAFESKISSTEIRRRLQEKI